MTRFLAIYNGVAEESEKGKISGQQQSEFMNAWASWAKAHEQALVDPGAPLFMKKVVTADGVENFTDSKTGYAIVEADTHDEAVRIFSHHPHLRLIRENSIEVLECPPVPGQSG